MAVVALLSLLGAVLSKIICGSVRFCCYVGELTLQAILPYGGRTLLYSEAPPRPPLLPSRPALQSLARVRPCLHTYIHTTLQPRPSKFCPPPLPPLQQQVFFVFVKRSFGGWKHDMGVGGGGGRAVHT